MFICTVALALIPLSLASPVLQHLAPIRRAVDFGGVSVGGHTISIKADTVDPKNRLQWLNRLLNAEGVTLDYNATQSLELGWSEMIFNGFAGTFTPEVINVLRRQPEVAWIEERPSLNRVGVLT